MKAEAIMLHPADNVITVVHGASAGQKVHYFKNSELCWVVANQRVPPCHKIAVASIAKGQRVIKYGEVIGDAQGDIAPGDWVSHLNISSLPRDYGRELSE